MPTRGIYDNMKTAVTRVFTGKERIFNRRFDRLVHHAIILEINAASYRRKTAQARVTGINTGTDPQPPN